MTPTTDNPDRVVTDPDVAARLQAIHHRLVISPYWTVSQVREDVAWLLDQVRALSTAQPELRCTVCDQPVPDAGDLVCVDCYDVPRQPLANPVTLSLSVDDCHTLLGHLLSVTMGADAPLTPLRVRFSDALEAASRAGCAARAVPEEG